MAQIQTLNWTSEGVALNLSVGFIVTKIEVWRNETGTPLRFEWTNQMEDASFYDLGTVFAFTAGNGFTPLEEEAAYGGAISAFTNANPGVITVNDTATFGVAIGDTIKVSGLADDSSTAFSLNDTFTVAGVTATTITLDDNTTAFSTYVSGGFAVRVSDINDIPIPIQNLAILGITLGTGVVGPNNAIMTAVVYGEESVV